jgi:Uma2 family endonuclease
MAVPEKMLEMMSAEAYLARERQAQERSEFDAGICIAMSGGTRWHNLLTAQIFTALFQYLVGKPCTPYMADMRLYIEAYHHYVYPDIMVVCREEAYIAADMVNDATVIIEVLSPSTEAYDRGKKFLHYQCLPSLREYVLISPESMQVEVYRRGNRRKWEYESLNQLTDVLVLESLQFTMSLAELYQAIRFNSTEK